MSDDRDRLGLGYTPVLRGTRSPAGHGNRLPFRFTVTETSPGRVKDTALNLQLCLKSGEVLETAKTKLSWQQGDRTGAGPDRRLDSPSRLDAACRSDGQAGVADPPVQSVSQRAGDGHASCRGIVVSSREGADSAGGRVQVAAAGDCLRVETKAAEPTSAPLNRTGE